MGSGREVNTPKLGIFQALTGTMTGRNALRVASKQYCAPHSNEDPTESTPEQRNTLRTVSRSLERRDLSAETEYFPHTHCSATHLGKSVAAGVCLVDVSEGGRKREKCV